MSQNRKRIKAWKYKNKIIGALQLSLIHKPAISVSQILHFFFKQIYIKNKNKKVKIITRSLKIRKTFWAFLTCSKKFIVYFCV